jgi:putative inorganic carbon (hco3(-)) transporter
MSSQDLAQSTGNGTGASPVNEGDNAIQLADVVRTPTLAADETPVEPGETPLPPVEGVYNPPPPYTLKFLRSLSPFWHDRLIEAGLILSMGLYYLVGNPNFGAGAFLHLPPYLYSFPFLAIFACLAWYRLAFAVALQPLALPYYYVQKTVFSAGSHHLDFGLAEISLAVCALVALGQLLVERKAWRYWLSRLDLRDRLGPFAIPVLIFVVAALVSIVVAVDRSTALRAFREEVFDPLLYVLLALCCLRTRGDLKRLLGAFLGSALIVAVIGLIQYRSIDGGRVHAMYGSANSIGLFFDYILPIGMALLIFQLGKLRHSQGNLWLCLLILAAFIPLIAVLVFSQSLGTALALPVALLFLLAMSARSRKTLLFGAAALIVLAIVVGIVLHKPLTHFIANWHDNSKGISTAAKRIYLWIVAWHMIQHYPIFGVGMDNWLCHYTANTFCAASVTQQHYLISWWNGQGTGLGDEPTLSHPHDIFLHVWVSIGIFGLLAFITILVFFYWLFARIVRTVRQSTHPEIAALEWMVLGAGGSMLAALSQGLIDSSFLEQDLAFCFWMVVATLLILRVFSGTSWRKPEAIGERL